MNLGLTHFKNLVKELCFADIVAGHILELYVPNILDNENLSQRLGSNHSHFWSEDTDEWLNMLNDSEKRLTCKAYWVIVLCWNLLFLFSFFFSFLFVCSFLLFSPLFFFHFFLSSPICHFPISCLMTAGSSSIITFTELSANVRGNSILLNHRESGLEKLQNIQKLARWLLL